FCAANARNCANCSLRNFDRSIVDCAANAETNTQALRIATRNKIEAFIKIWNRDKSFTEPLPGASLFLLQVGPAVPSGPRACATYSITTKPGAYQSCRTPTRHCWRHRRKLL